MIIKSHISTPIQSSRKKFRAAQKMTSEFLMRARCTKEKVYKDTDISREENVPAGETDDNEEAIVENVNEKPGRREHGG